MQSKPTKSDIALAAEIMAQHAIWAAISKRELYALLEEHAAIARYEKGACIWGQGAPFAQNFALVLEGAAQVKKDHVLLSVHREGDYFGLATLYHPSGYYAADIVALNACKLLLLPRDAIDPLLDAHPSIAREYIAYLSQRVYFLTGRLDAVTAGSAAQRLEYYLREQAMPRDGEWVYTLGNLTALAKSLNMSRATLYRALEDLEAQGVIVKDKGQIVVQS
ncbi:MAG: Crp/Fnr family transcriptional regulator [Oscillospiraceae bacterium]|nr:Crp/Fnr family transcriptional regulator [Oscillospiraceae bacterium]